MIIFKEKIIEKYYDICQIEERLKLITGELRYIGTIPNSITTKDEILYELKSIDNKKESIDILYANRKHYKIQRTVKHKTLKEFKSYINLRKGDVVYINNEKCKIEKVELLQDDIIYYTDHISTIDNSNVNLKKLEEQIKQIRDDRINILNSKLNCLKNILNNKQINNKGESKMCYSGICNYEKSNGQCFNYKTSFCPEFMVKKCKCGSELMQKLEDGKYHCMNCNRIIKTNSLLYKAYKIKNEIKRFWNEYKTLSKKYSNQTNKNDIK